MRNCKERANCINIIRYIVSAFYEYPISLLSLIWLKKFSIVRLINSYTLCLQYFALCHTSKYFFFSFTFPLFCLHIAVAFIDRLGVCVAAIIVVILIATHINSAIYSDFSSRWKNCIKLPLFFIAKWFHLYIRSAEFAFYFIHKIHAAWPRRTIYRIPK